MTAQGVKLCLNMIVKNEGANIERCLRGVADQLSCWVILDTGSTDDTKDRIRHFFAQRGIQGELHDGAFENFSQARNEALDLARALPLSFDYVLFADADMELVVADPAFALRLEAGAYRVSQTSGVTYWNVRLLRRDVPARYIGVTHEYLDVRDHETRNLEGVHFVDHATGANRAGKFDRDAALLKAALAVETDESLRARYTFYLANSLRDAGDQAAALPFYLERARLGHWYEEVFVSLLNAAQLKEALGHPSDEILATFAAATAACPTRAEALHGAARHCRDKALHEKGYQFAIRGIAIPKPKESLFLADWIYDHGLLDELAVHAYWSGRHAESVVACDRLLARTDLAPDFRERVTMNRQFALDRLRDEDIRRNEIAAGTRKGPAIPRLFHFITGLDSTFGGKPFSFVHYIAIVSALEVNAGFTARVYYEYEPQGDYWDRVKPLVTRVPIVAPREFCGHAIEHFANRADICRLQILLEHGGIYLDLDTICQKPFAPLLDGSVVMGLEQTSDGTTIGLCNATIIAPVGAAFLRLWLDSYNDFTIWNRFAVQLPMQIAQADTTLARIEPHTSFFWPPWDEGGIAALFTEDHSYPEAYSFHLWESKSWSFLKDLDAASVSRIDTTYNRVARRFAAPRDRAIQDRAIQDRAIQDRATQDGATQDGTTHDGTTHDDAAHDGAAHDNSSAASHARAIDTRASRIDGREMQNMMRHAVSEALTAFGQRTDVLRRLDMQVEDYWAGKRARSTNPLLAKGEKFFSQSDEDGITLEICRRLGLSGGCALEFGVGNGLENNTLILLMSGWTVAWVGGEDIAFKVPDACGNLHVSKSWVTADNCAALASSAMASLRWIRNDLLHIDLLSIDLDGNDIYILEELLKAGVRPSVLIVEYNGKFPPPIRWRVGYDPNHHWDGSDYQGASLQAFVDLCGQFGYQLVCCNITGTNAYFVRSEAMRHFDDVPTEIADLFVAADYNWFIARGHPTSPRTIEAMLTQWA